MVKYNRQREAAEQAVAGLAGVRDIRDDIKLSYDADPADVTLLVQAALDRNALIRDDSDISVDTHGNTVTLSGHVRTRAERDAVVGAAWMAGGVFQVRDELDITRLTRRSRALAAWHARLITSRTPRRMRVRARRRRSRGADSTRPCAGSRTACCSWRGQCRVVPVSTRRQNHSGWSCTFVTPATRRL